MNAQERHSGREEIDLLVSIWQLWGGAWCQARCWWFGRCGCSGGRAPLPAQWGTSQSSRTHLSGARGSKWWTWDRSWGKTGRHKGRGAYPSGRWRQDAHSDHSHHTSGQGWRWAGIHPQGGRTWGCSRSLHSDSSPGGAKRQRAWKRQGEDGGSTQPFTLLYSAGSFFLGIFPLPILSLLHSFCPTLDSEFSLSELLSWWFAVVSESYQRP